MSTNAERLRTYKAKMAAHGFKRLNVYVAAELVEYLDEHQEQGECRGRTLERLLLGEAAKRPDYWTRQERAERQRRRVRNKAQGRKFTAPHHVCARVEIP